MLCATSFLYFCLQQHLQQVESSHRALFLIKLNILNRIQVFYQNYDPYIYIFRVKVMSTFIRGQVAVSFQIAHIDVWASSCCSKHRFKFFIISKLPVMRHLELEIMMKFVFWVSFLTSGITRKFLGLNLRSESWQLMGQNSYFLALIAD